MLHHSSLNSSAFQWFGFTSSASPQPNDKETSQPGNGQENKEQNEAVGDAVAADGKAESGSARLPQPTLSEA